MSDIQSVLGGRISIMRYFGIIRFEQKEIIRICSQYRKIVEIELLEFKTMSIQYLEFGDAIAGTFQVAVHSHKNHIT